MNIAQWWKVVFVLMAFFVRFLEAQYAADTLKYAEVMSEQQGVLDAQLEAHPDVEVEVFPERTLADTAYYEFCLFVFVFVSFSRLRSILLCIAMPCYALLY